MASDLFPPRGPCHLCGHPDARHRDVDAWIERAATGEPADAIAADYGVPVALVDVAVLAATYREDTADGQ